MGRNLGGIPGFNMYVGGGNFEADFMNIGVFLGTMILGAVTVLYRQ